jgi:type II secretory pathway predicted ATPase ExeA
MTDLTDTFKPGNAGFRSKPFSGAEAEFFFTNTNHLDAYIQLLQGLRQQKHLTVLTGEAGTGKTLLLRKLVREAPAQVQCVFCYSTNLDFNELLTVISDQLGLATQELDQSAKLEAFKEYVHTCLVQQKAVALIIDDAHNLRGEVLDRLLTLTQSDPPEGCPVQLVLSGMPGLEDILAQRRATYSPEVKAVHIHLDRLADTDVGTFIRRRVQSAGDPQAETLFSTPVVECIAHYAHGIPRLINKLCDRTLLVAHLNGQSTLSTALVDEAASQLLLQQPANLGALETAFLPSAQAADHHAGIQTTPAAEAVTRQHSADRGIPLSRALLRNQNPAHAPERIELVSHPFMVFGRYNESNNSGLGDFSLGFLPEYTRISRLHCAVCAQTDGLAIMYVGGYEHSKYSYIAVNQKKLPPGRWRRLEPEDVLDICGLYKIRVTLTWDDMPTLRKLNRTQLPREQLSEHLFEIVKLLKQSQNVDTGAVARQQLKTCYFNLIQMQDRAAELNGIDSPGPLLYARFQREDAGWRRVIHIYLPKRLPIGNSQQAGLSVDAPGITPQHAELLFKDGGYWIQNLAGRGEVQVCNHGLAPNEAIPLEHGDDIAIGAARFIFEHY